MSWYVNLLFSVAATSEGTATTEEEEGQEEEEPKEPVILEQPAARIFSTIGEDLKLELRVKGEAPLRFVCWECCVNKVIYSVLCYTVSSGTRTAVSWTMPRGRLWSSPGLCTQTAASTAARSPTRMAAGSVAPLMCRSIGSKVSQSVSPSQGMWVEGVVGGARYAGMVFM